MLASWNGAALFGVAVLGTAAPAHAAGPAPTCLFAPQVLHRVDATLRASDVAAPATPVVVSVDTFRRNGMTCTRASCVANSCGSTGTVRIDLAPSADDDTPPSQLGYRLILVRGELPESMQAAIGVPLAAGHVLYLRPGFEELPLLDVELAAVAIDAAGNESAPTAPFGVHFDGCTLAAVGDRCEDELDPDTDLSAVLDPGASSRDPLDSLDALDEPLDPEPRAAGGVSCSVRPLPPTSGAGVGLSLGALAALFAWRRTQRVKTVPHEPLAAPLRATR